MNTTEHSLDYIRKAYNVPANIGQRVRYCKEHIGTITGGSGTYIKITFDADNEENIGRYHPTWEMEYLGQEKEA